MLRLSGVVEDEAEVEDEGVVKLRRLAWFWLSAGAVRGRPLPPDEPIIEL